MTLLDWIIVAFTVVLVVYGARQGFVVGALSLAGFALGVFVGTRLAPLVLPKGSSSPYAPLLGLAGALLAGGVLATGLGGLGYRVRSAVRLPGFRSLDAGLGSVLSGIVALGIAWIAGAAALQVPGQQGLRASVQRSLILRRLNDVLPPSGSVLNALARIDPLQQLHGPQVSALPPPRAAIARTPGVRAAAGSVVRVLGTACGLGIEGSGWVAGPGVVVTNAHVVAGESDTVVELGGTGSRLTARALAFDPANDVAVLRVAGLDAPALPLTRHPAAGAAAAILGFPENGPYAVRPGRLGQAQSVSSQDAYGRGPVQRTVVPLRGVVQSGNSGGPMVDAHGRVVTTIFASTVGSRRPGGYGVPNEIVSRTLRAAAHPVSTGPCAH